MGLKVEPDDRVIGIGIFVDSDCSDFGRIVLESA